MTTEENLACAKAAQRRQGIAARRALSPEARQAADAAICARAAALPQWQKAGRVLAYAAFGGEPDLSALLAGCGKQVAYPICGEECSMRGGLSRPGGRLDAGRLWHPDAGGGPGPDPAARGPGPGAGALHRL